VDFITEALEAVEEKDSCDEIILVILDFQEDN